MTRLREELIALRGPLPEDASLEHHLQQLQHSSHNLQQHSSDETDTVSLCSADTIASAPSSVALINVWIPGAFLVGGGTPSGAASGVGGGGGKGDQHHVYQVYVRIRDDEWTVYRRFAHFHQLHKLLARTYPAVARLSFPQKKPFGYKEQSVVEVRRGRLQEYLRHVVNILLSSCPQLAAAPDRRVLTSLLPFLQSDSLQASGGQEEAALGAPTLPQYAGL